ncbi:MAG: Cytochrome c oxidase subunit 6A, mitochondrial [Alyxoria varia]|nr:MAG: Cytochrome c oxidase subunit 6A, mitochondrial [Alyxoria varia]
MSLLRNTGLTAARNLSRRSVPRQQLQNLQRRHASNTEVGPVRNAGHTVDKLEGQFDNAFNRERLAVKKHAAATAAHSHSVVLPALIMGGANTWVQWVEHWEHQSHEPPVHERPQYSYMNIRTKAFPWGDGDKSLFWNDNYNYKPSADE